MSVQPTSRCLVTGSSDPTSIGYACAAALLKAGAACVTIMGRDKAKVDAAVASLLKGGKVYGVVGDLKKPETMAAVVDEAAGLMGGHIDIMVVSGGNGGSEYLGLDLHDPAAYRMSQDVAVISPMLLTHAAVSKKDKEQAIVMVSSLGAQIPWPDTAPHNTAKAAQNCLVQQLAFQYRDQGVRINAVLPACIHTGKLDVMANKKGIPVADYAALRASVHPMGRNGTPDEVAASVLFLASPASTYTTGTLLPVDGGLMLSNWWNKPQMLAEFKGNKGLAE